MELFRRQVDHARHVDRQFGAITVLDELRATITRLQALLTYSTGAGHREALAGVLTEAAALAGWEALDRNALSQAWDHHETTQAAAREARSTVLLAHATAQQAFILIDLGEIADAVDQLSHARALAEHSAPALPQSWLAAAHGESLAALGHRDEAIRAFDTASAVLTSNPVHSEALPYLFLAGAHLDRWHGHALSRLGEPTAIDQLTDALPRLHTSFVRAKTGMTSISRSPTPQPARSASTVLVAQHTRRCRSAVAIHLGCDRSREVGCGAPG